MEPIININHANGPWQYNLNLLKPIEIPKCILCHFLDTILTSTN